MPPDRPLTSCRAMWIRMPAATMVMTRDDPPYEMKGNGMPVTGRTPTTAPTLIKVSLASQATRPTANTPPNRWGERVAARMPNQTKAPKSTRTRPAPMKPSSSPMTEKMKSVCALGRNPHWACPPAQAGTDEGAGAEPDQGLHHLIPRPRPVGRRVDEGEEPLPPVGRRHRRH